MVMGALCPRDLFLPGRGGQRHSDDVGPEQPQDPGADFPGASRERALFTLLRSEYKLVFGLAGDEIGYVIPRSQWDAKKPFAYGRNEDQYGEINSVGPSAAARLAEAFERLLGR